MVSRQIVGGKDGEHFIDENLNTNVQDVGSAAEAVKDIKSPGVVRVEALASCITFTDRILIFVGIFLVAYAYGLDGTLRYTYQPIAASSFGQHSLQATVNVVRSVIAAAAQPTAAKIADVFGRVELICLSVVFYVVGTVVEALSTSIDTFAGGSVIYQIGYTMMILLVEIVVADITSTRARLFFSYIPALPFLVNTWVSGNVSEAVLGVTTWKWGVGMWCIIYPLCALPLILSLLVVSRRAKKRGLLNGHQSSFRILGFRKFALELFWLLDVIGILLLIAVFALVLVPLTIAGGFQLLWNEAHVIAPLVVGFLCIPIFILWELRAPRPLVPFSLMKDRAVWAPLGIAVLLNFAYGMQANFLFTVLRIAFGFSLGAATRITSLYSFTSVVVGVLLGLVVFKVRRLKIFVVAGTALYMVAFGLLVHFRGSSESSHHAGLVGAQVLLGVAGGLFPYATQASLQVSLHHENLAVMTALFLAVYNIGSALGNTVSGAMWSQLLPAQLDQRLSGLNSTLAMVAYSEPLTSVVDNYPIGTPERGAIIGAYQYIQRLLTICGLCLCVPLVFFALMLRNPKLNDDQTLAKDDDSDARSVSDVNVPADDV
ncbi:hypothetical protein DCS_04413 [Drechmeria coniospora]|uniref:Major facilitator superfamily (MFS) profile domain-containing protein n=1 Tax=Drechmeria coniospora TaxID=98403 RepID=A0A151GJX6_DRECN|nr:hypothetical protein DCS_04413 [Drechmeria coniospora]KYK57404.1 hypothetical protein DCS_04413 [Drechmeria coniospora]